MGYLTLDNEVVWGDKPQDIIDAKINSLLGKNWEGDNISNQKYATIKSNLIKNKIIRESIDKIYLKDFGRNATDEEYSNLLRMGMLKFILL